MVTIETTLPGDVDTLARRLRDEPGVFVLRASAAQALHAADAEASFLGCDPVETSDDMLPASPLHDPAAWAGKASAPRWVGMLPYECARAMERARPVADDARVCPSIATPHWFRYAAVARVDHTRGCVVIEADDIAAAARLREKLDRHANVEARAFHVGTLSWNDDDERHAASVRRVLEYIRAGDVYQVNLARRATFHFEGDALAFFEALAAAAPSPYGFYLDTGAHVIASSTPELALESRGASLRTCPIKGTRTRGADAMADAKLCTELDSDTKERAELTMAVDLHRNDLGKVARPGSVRVRGTPRVVHGRTVMSRIAEVVASLDDGRTPRDAVLAMLPCGSITGAPKIRAMEIIAELETARRGLYTGMLGTVRRNGDVTLAMAIRTATLARARGAWVGEYFAGGGIVLESDPAREAEETRWKAEHLRRLESSARPL